MPTAKQRITINLDDETYRLLASLAYFQKMSMSRIVTDLIGTAIPSLHRLEMVLEHAAGAPSELLRDMEYAMSSIDRQLNLLQDADAERARTKEHVRTSASSRPGPPTSNRGVRIPPPKSSKSMPARVPAKLKESRK